jgi:hypothetical protein
MFDSTIFLLATFHGISVGFMTYIFYTWVKLHVWHEGLAFTFLNHPVKNNICHVIVHKLFMVCRFVDDLLELNPLDFEILMYLHQMSIGSGIFPKTFCQLNCIEFNVFIITTWILFKAKTPRDIMWWGWKTFLVGIHMH